MRHQSHMARHYAAGGETDSAVNSLSTVMFRNFELLGIQMSTANPAIAVHAVI